MVFTATTTDINRLEGVSAGTAIAGKALVASDNTKDISGLGAIDCGAITSSGKLNVDGTITGKTSLTLDDTTLTESELAVLDGVSAGTATADKALVVNSSKNISGLGTIDCGAITSRSALNVDGTITGTTSLTLNNTTINTTELAVLDGANHGSATASKALVVDSNKDIKSIRNLSIDGEFSDGNYTFDTNGNVSGLGTIGCGAITSTGTISGKTSLTLDTKTITSDELGVLAGAQSGVATAGKALVVDTNKNIYDIKNLTIDGEFSDGNYTFDTNGNVSGLGTVDCGAITSSGKLNVTGTISGKTSLTLDTKTVTSNELGVLAGAKSGTAIAGKALVASDNTKDISGLGAIDCGAITSSGKLNVNDTITGKTSLTLDDTTLTESELAVLDGVSAGTAKASKALVLGSSKNVSELGDIGCGAITSSGKLNVTGTISGKTSLTLDTKTVTSNELGVLAGAKSGAATAGKALVVDTNKNIYDIKNLTIDGEFSDGNYTFDTNGNVSGLGTVDCGAITSSGKLNVTGTISGKTSLTLDTKTVTSNELGVLAGAKSGTAIAGKALVASDNTKDISGLGAIDCGAITSSGKLNVNDTITGKTSLTLDDTTLTESELAVLDGVSAGTAKASKALVLGSSKNVSELGDIGCGAITSTGTITGKTSLTLDDTTLTESELAVLDGVSAGTAKASKALVLGSSKNVSELGDIGCGAITSTGTISGKTSLTLDDTTLTESELAVLDGVSAGTAKASKALVLGSSKNVSELGDIGCGAITSTGTISGKNKFNIR